VSAYAASVAGSADRSASFPAIEARYGRPMSFWFAALEERSDQKYAEQMAFLQEEHGFSRAHANALVLYCRGSKSAHRFATLDEYLEPHDATKQKSVRSILAAITDEFPDAELVIAWNQPMLKLEGHYVFGLGVFKNHILIAPFNADVIDAFRDRLVDYKVNKKTIQVPVDWEIDRALLRDMVALTRDMTVGREH
jgi:uncharacterized protein YdhG (YjbR/CyaY superfamily)